MNASNCLTGNSCTIARTSDKLNRFAYLFPRTDSFSWFKDEIKELLNCYLLWDHFGKKTNLPFEKMTKIDKKLSKISEINWQICIINGCLSRDKLGLDLKFMGERQPSSWSNKNDYFSIANFEKTSKCVQINEFRTFYLRRLSYQIINLSLPNKLEDCSR